MQDSWTRIFFILSLLLLASPAHCLPKKQDAATGATTGATADTASTKATTKASTKGSKGGATTAAAAAAAVAGGISQATDGSTILDKTVQINGLSIRYKISAPADQFTSASGVTGAAAAANSTGTAGLNVLLHGDGGQSFFDFPNQAVQDNLMGVVVLAPDPNLFWGGGSGLQRTDGVAHSAAVNQLITQQLSQDVAFDPTKVFFTGVSGGSLMLSGFFMPAFGATYKTGVILNCGGLAPQVDVVDANTLATSMKIHFQSTKDELASLQPAIPAAITAYEKLATDAGLAPADIASLQTVDNTPDNGGHCGFDGTGFVKGVQLMASNYANVIGTNSSGVVTGINAKTVLTSVVGNENVVFTSAGQAQKM